MLDSYDRDVPDQPPLWSIDWPQLEFVLRRHHASSLHWDLRIRAKGVLYSWWMPRPPSLDPACPTRLGLAGPHNPKWMYSERRIPEGRPGAGPTIVEDHGHAMPTQRRQGSQEQRLHDGLFAGRIDLSFAGHVLRGAFLLERRGKDWWLYKRGDEFVKTWHEWTGVSPLSGRMLCDL